ncbi:gliding motility-associated C-terminal domain-containing protein [Pedobacter rhodius]|uniref:Gliding motility-associated C-terminal domain-containing protein n=1 Tax=Pedobacter rhodius TaxID=3004098 RepID=A0ABT4KSG7_9SPHI|nr:gliding motility-associated C-terminal domain-containing protein [Pedobacter sp. SJ11]MCZ4221874.1 gliding motility-associated C-terminal domain-containing protein [Pedobacter sp. SJ11]
MIKAILLKIFVFIFCIFFAELSHADNPSVNFNPNQGKDFKIINSLLSSVALRSNTYSNFKRIFQSASATPPTYSKHYIAPAPWQYWSKANQIVITTESTTTISGTITKSDGTLLYNFTCSAGVPYIERFTGLPGALPIHPLNTVVNGGGLIVTAGGSISVNLRNIASDQLGSDGNDANIKGNASLFSFGDAGIGTSFRVGYYRDGNLAGNERPTYSIMAIENNTIIKIAGAAVTTLNVGQSYLFQCPIGTLVESSGAAVMNTSARLDAPGGCGDGAYNPIPPIASLGSEYVIVRGEGNLTAEQTTVVSTEPDTKIRIEFFDENGIEKKVQNITIATAGDFKTFNHGYTNGGGYDKNNNTGRFSSSRIVSDKNILVFSGTGGISGGGGCEVDIATLVPIASCAGSKQVETYKFTSYKDGNLPYFGYILTKNTDRIDLTTKGTTPYTSKDIESITGIGPRKALGTSGLYLIKFTDANISYPNVITINSTSRLTVSMVQQSSDFSMSNFISRFPEKAEQPTVDMTDCTAAKLTASPASTGPYQWYFNGVAISGADKSTYIATTSGNYTVTSSLECGMSAQSLPLIISLCNIDRSITKTVDTKLPEVGEVVSFTLKAENLGSGNAIGVSVTDLLPADYQYVYSTVSEGNYDAATGTWSIGSMNSHSAATLVIKAKVLTQGVHVNNATITGPQADNVQSNDQSSASTSTTLGTVTLITEGADRNVCVNTAIADIEFLVGGGASGANVTNLPSGLTYNYDTNTKKLTITGTVNTPTPPAGITYTVTTTGGIPVSKTGNIIVRDNVTTPVFANGLTSTRCMGAGSDTYTATSSNSDGLVYSLLPANAGSIDPVTGRVTWALDFVGTATITAKATGCIEKSADFTVTVNNLPAAPGVSDVTYCKNQAAVPLTAALTETSLVWYNSSGAVISVPTPSTATVGTTDFYVSQKNANGCESAKSKITVTINDLPTAPGVSDVTYCKNQPAVPLTASLTETSLVWYNSSGAVISVPTPSTATVGTTDFYVSQKNANGCESAKSKITVTINDLPAAPGVSDVTYCKNQPAIPLTASLTETSLVWYNSSGTVISVPTPSTATVGATDYYVSQKNANGCESAKSKITVTINDLPTAPGVSDVTYCKNQPAVPLTASLTETSLVWYNSSGAVISVPTPSTATVGTTDFYVSQKNANGCESAKSKITVTINDLPTAPGVSDVTYCKNQPAVPLTASLTETSLVWYNSSGAVISVPTPSTATVGATDYYVSQKNTQGCEGPKAELKVTIIALPAAPVTAHLTYCQDEQNIPALTAAGSDLTWYDANGTKLSAAPVPTTSAAGETKYYVSQKNTQGCEGPKAELKVTIIALPAAPVTAHLTYCQDEQNIPALTAAGSDLTWYDANGTKLSAAPVPTTSAAGETKYYVSQKNTQGCEGPKAELKVTIIALPAAPVTAHLTYCQDEQNIPALTAAGSDLTWYDANGTKLSAAPVPTTSAAGETKYFVSQKNTQGCEGPKAELKVTIIALPDAPVTAHLTYCQDEQNIPALTAAGSDLTWYDANGTKLSAAPVPTTSAAGETKYYVSQKNTQGCEGPKAELKVTIIALPAAPVTAHLTYCQDEQNIPALTAAGSDLTWYDANGTKLSATPVPTTSAAGETKYYVSQKNTQGCEGPKAELKVTIIALPAAPVTAHLTYCQDEQNIPALTAAGSDLTWYDANGTKLSATPVPTTSAAGETKYYVSQKNTQGCEGPKSELKVTIKALPDAPATLPLSYCHNQTNIPALTATASANASLIWYNEAGTLLASAPIPSTATVGEQKFYVSQKFATGCEGPKALLTVTINALPDAPVTLPLNYCQNQTNIPALTATASANASLIWYNEAGTLLAAAPSPSTATVGEQKFYVSQKFTTCEGPKALLTVTINALPAPVTANLSYCQNQTNIPALTATASANASLIWYNEAGTLLAAAPIPSTVTVGEQKFYVSQKFTTGCEGPKALLTVTINALTDAPATLPLSYCQNQTNIPALTATASANASLIWYNEAGTLLAAAPIPSTVTVGEQKFYVSQKFTTGCEGPKALLTVTINALPDAPVTLPLSYCQNQTNIPALTATASANASLIWYNEAETLLAAAPSPSTATVGEQKFYVSQKFATGCEGPKALLTVTINALPDAPVTTNLSYCQNQTNIPALTATASANASLIWYNEAGTLLASAPIPLTATVGEQKFYVSQKFSTGCEGPKALLTVTINALPDAPVTLPLSYCQNQTNIPALTATASANASLIWYNEAGTLLAAAPIPSTATVGEQKFYVSQKFSTGCEGPKALLTVTINALPDAPVTASLSYCQNQTNIPALTATASANASLIWYNEAGTLLAAAPIPSTAIVGEQKFYVSQKFSTGCEGPKALLTVTINALPDAPATLPLSYCQNQTNIPALTATASANASLIWYNEAGTLLASAPIPSTATVGEQKFYVSQKFATGCEGPKALLTVTINALPDAPVTLPLSYCQNQTNIPALTASAISGASLIWYNEAGTLLAAAPSPSTAIVGEQKFYVSQKFTTGCEGPKALLTVTINALPPAPATQSLSYCQNQTNIPALTATASANASLIWYNEAGTLLAAAPSPSTATVGEQKFYVSQKFATGCEGPKALLTVTINALPPAPVTTNLKYCQNQPNTQPLTATGSNLIWYDANGIILPGAPVPTTSTVGTINYYVSQTNLTGCESAKSKITVEVFAAPEKPTVSASGPVVICEGGSVILKSSPSVNYQWFKDGEVLSGAVGQALTVSETGLYKVITKNANGCGSEFSEGINVLVNKIAQKPAIQVQGSPTVCEGQAVVLSSSYSTGNQWFKDGVLIPGATEQTYLAKLTGKYTLVINTSSGCSSKQSDAVAVSVNSMPVVPVITTQSSMLICKGGVAALTSSVSSGNQWYKNGALIPGATGPIYIANSAGSYMVKSKNVSGCESLNSNAINLAEEEFKIALQTSSNRVEYGSKIQLSTSSKLSYKILSWSPTNIFIEGDAKSQSLVLLKNITVTVNAVSDNGCYASATINIQVDKKRDLFIPNTFTPNGDGKNDVIKVYGTGIEMIDWAVYSQWGQLIYKSKAQDASWDGTFGGVMQPVGVYVYKCVIRFTDGAEITKHGSINLVR